MAKKMVKGKTLQELTLFNRFLFNETMEAPGNMETVLEIILETDVVLKSLPKTEREQLTNARRTLLTSVRS